MKKDPLQRDPTAYDVLGVEPGAGDDEIDRAIPVGADRSTEAEDAMKALRDPVRRALVDLFLYHDRYLDDLAFADPLETLGETAGRRRADERWRAIERKGFPMPAATHSIAVLSYWEARGSGRNGPDLPTAPDVTGRLWETALSRYAALIASDAFWTEWGILTGNRGSGGGAANALEARLTGELEEMAAILRNRGDVPGEARVREHLALFRSELRSARALPALRILSGRGLSPAAIAAGPHLLTELGLLEKVRGSVEAQHADLLPLFSPLAHIGMLIEEKEYANARAALERLDTEGREAPEAREMEARVHLELGAAALAGSRADEAIAHWERALERAEVRADVALPISEAVLTRAKLLHSREEHDEAIQLLQRVLPLGERGILGVPLAHFLLERADGRIERATDGAGDDEADLRPAIAEMRGAVADLDEAVALDPTNSGTRDRRNEAEDMLLGLVTRAGPDAGGAVEPEEVSSAAGESADEPAPAAVAQQPVATRGSALVAAGVALWIGIGLLALIAYPLLMPQRLGGLGTIIALGVAVGWIAANVVGWRLLR